MAMRVKVIVAECLCLPPEELANRKSNQDRTLEEKINDFLADPMIESIIKIDYLPIIVGTHLTAQGRVPKQAISATIVYVGCTLMAPLGEHVIGNPV